MEKFSGRASATESASSDPDLDRMLRPWSADRDVIGARDAALELTAVELNQRITKVRR